MTAMPHVLRAAVLALRALVCIPASAGPWQLDGLAVGVYDGYPLRPLDAVKIRVDGIDAPELGMPFGQASRRSLAT